MSSTQKSLTEVFDEAIQLVEPVIDELLVKDVDPRFQELQRHHMKAGGKRIRPVISLVSSRNLGGEDSEVIYPAAALEILHNYTLIVDDMIDNSPMRRNSPTVWKQFGRSIAECVAWDYASSAYQALGRSSQAQILLDKISKTLKIIGDGEILDILFERFGREDDPYVVENRFKDLTIKDYFEMAGKKTASLFATCSEIGGICARGSEKELACLKNYGYNLGIAFQIQDDFLDTFGDESKFGKKIGKDIEERKASNIVVLLALEELNDNDKKDLNNIFIKKEIKDLDVKRAIELIQKTSAREQALSLAQEYNKKAKVYLKDLPQNEWNNVLEEITDFVIKREK
ncbi:MAG: polyprenyl synthetase family protein [Patescibacteria group bacterium]|nr:polyprenyl synthetase family protein [Patescibacteria group bacterium]